MGVYDPKINKEALTRQLKLNILEEIEDTILKCKDKNNKTIILKLTYEPEILIYKEVLSKLRKTEKKFKRLKLPEYIKAGNKNWIMLKYYKGKTFNDIWNENEAGKIGGSKMGITLAKETAEVISDLLKIDVNKIRNNGLKNIIGKFEFSFKGWIKLLHKKLPCMLNQKYISEQQAKKALKILGNGYVDKRNIFSNGDIYPRNLIEYKKKIILIDWQCRDRNFRVNCIDQLEGIIAFVFIHMWGNVHWQNTFLKELQKHITINPIDFQKALLIKSFDQAYFWIMNRTLAISQMLIFANALSHDYVANLIKSNKP